MSALSPARPDLAAHREATTISFAVLVRELSDLIGKKLTAYIGGVKDVRAVDRWIEGTAPYKDAEERLRFAFRVVKTLSNPEHPHVVQAWLTGLNPELNDRVRSGFSEKVNSRPSGRRFSPRRTLSWQEGNHPFSLFILMARYTVSDAVLIPGNRLTGHWRAPMEHLATASMTRKVRTAFFMRRLSGLGVFSKLSPVFASTSSSRRS